MSSFSKMKVPSMHNMNERVKAYLVAVPPRKELVFWSENSTEPFCASVKTYWLNAFDVEVNYETTNPETREKMLEVLEKNFFMQVIYRVAVDDLLTTNRKEVLAKVKTYKDKQINPIILVVSLVVQFLQKGFINQANGTTKQLLQESIQCCQESARNLSSHLGSDSYKDSMERHSASTEGEDRDRKALCTVLNSLSNLAMYTTRASEDEIDLVLGIRKRVNTEGEASASGGGSTLKPQETKAVDTDLTSGGGSTLKPQETKAVDKAPASGGGGGSKSQKRNGPECESPASGGDGESSSQKRMKPDGKQPADADEIADEASFKKKCHGFFSAIYEDPDNLQRKWTFKTLGLLKDVACKCDNVPVRITYALEIVEHFQKCKWIENDFVGEIVKEALINILFQTKDEELASAMENAVGLIKQYV